MSISSVEEAQHTMQGAAERVRLGRVNGESLPSSREEMERKPMGKCLSWGWHIKQSHEEIPLACLSIMRSQSGEGKGTCGWVQLYHTGALGGVLTAYL